MGPQRTRRYVRAACHRCHRQKLKCDVERPCTLCKRIGTPCLPRGRNLEKPHLLSTDTSDNSNGTVDRAAAEVSNATPMLVEQAVSLNDTISGSPEIRSWGLGLESLTESDAIDHPLANIGSSDLARYTGLQRKLLAAMPKNEVVDLLVDTYFDRVHWFMLVFYQDDFRQNLRRFQEKDHTFSQQSKPFTGFLCVLSAVLCISLQHLGDYRTSILQGYGMEKSVLQANILSVLEGSLLAIISLNSIEAVQACVLLGTFYLYQGDPTAAWPVCGCALRIAQALELHRKRPTHRDQHQAFTDTEHHQEVRKRAWWAVYEIEIFCYTLYGYTCTISDDSCDVDFLASLSQESHDEYQQAVLKRCNLLLYKPLMSKLAAIVKAALNKLYSYNGVGKNRHQHDLSLIGQLDGILDAVADAEQQLLAWFSKIPNELRVQSAMQTGYKTVEEAEKALGASGERFDQHILSMQALVLELAYQNARILVCRPVLHHKFDNFEGNPATQLASQRVKDIYTTCHRAAFKTTELLDLPAFGFAIYSYAASFIRAHLFTAGVALCMSATVAPFTQEATQAKIGLRKLINLKDDMIAESSVSLRIKASLRKLTAIMLKKELDSILGHSNQSAVDGESERDLLDRDPTLSELLPGEQQIPESQQGPQDFSSIGAMPITSDSMATFENDIAIPDSNSLFPDLSQSLFHDQEQAWIWNFDLDA